MIEKLIKKLREWFVFISKFYWRVFVRCYLLTLVGPIGVALLFLMLAGLFDDLLGRLFHFNPALSRVFWRQEFAPQLWVGIVVSCVIVTAIFFAYLLLRMNWPADTADHWTLHAPRFGKDEHENHYAAFIIGMVCSWTATFGLALAIWKFFEWTESHEYGFVLWLGVGLGGLAMVTIHLLGRRFMRGPLQNLLNKTRKVRPREQWLIVIVLSLVGIGSLYFVQHFESDFPWLPFSVGVVAYLVTLPLGLKTTHEDDRRLHLTAILVLPALAFLFLFRPPQIGGAYAICVLILIAIGIQALLGFYMRRPRWIAIMVLVALFLLAGLKPFRGRIKDLADMYDVAPLKLKRGAQFLTPVARQAGLAHGTLLTAVTQSPLSGAGLTTLGNREPIPWFESKYDRKPLVIVCASGGGISAAVWTGTVLGKLEKRNPTLPYHIRLMTGASGGMLGAAYYVATLNAPRADGTASHSAYGGSSSPLELDTLAENLGKDALSRVAMQWVGHDIPRLFDPFPTTDDRGEALQSAWADNLNGALETPMGSLALGEQTGWRPSLIFSPMIIDNGRRLLISNLDLSGLYTNETEKVDGGAGIDSIDAIELFQLFPNLQGQLRISTAARLNSSFPYVSPAPVLPIAERWRIADAGYFDDYGVDLACRWLKNNQEWLIKHVPRVLIIQIRAFPEHEAEADHSTLLSRAVEGLTTPVEGAIAARSGSMRFRNDRELMDLVSKPSLPGSPRIQTVTIECTAQSTPLTWSLTRDEREQIMKAAEDPTVMDKIERVSEWLGVEDRATHEWANDPSIRRIRDRGKLVVGITTDEESGIYLFRTGPGGYDGIDIDLIKRVAEELRWRLDIPKIDVEFREMPFVDLLAATRSGNVDVAISAISYRPEREARFGVSFTVPYGTSRQVVLSDKTTKAAWKQIHVQRGTVSHTLANRWKQEREGLGDAEVHDYEKLKDALTLEHLAVGQVVIADQAFVDWFKLEHSEEASRWRTDNALGHPVVLSTQPTRPWSRIHVQGGTESDDLAVRLTRERKDLGNVIVCQHADPRQVLCPSNLENGQVIIADKPDVQVFVHAFERDQPSAKEWVTTDAFGPWVIVTAGPADSPWKDIHLQRSADSLALGLRLKQDREQFREARVHDYGTLGEVLTLEHLAEGQGIIARKPDVDEYENKYPEKAKYWNVTEIEEPHQYYEEQDFYAMVVSKEAPQLLFHINDILRELNEPIHNGQSELSEIRINAEKKAKALLDRTSTTIPSGQSVLEFIPAELWRWGERLRW